jgi:RNA polymerase sigma factor (sigma-70 family)
LFNPYLGDVEEIIKNYTGHIIKAATEYVNGKGNRKSFLEDLVQEGHEGMLKAYSKYGASQFIKGVKFWTFAYKFVHGKIIDFITLQTNMIRPSKLLNSIALNIKKNNLQTSTVQEISEFLGCTHEMAKRSLDFMGIRYVSSLNQPINEEDNNEIQDTIAHHEDFSEIYITQFMKLISIQEREIIRFRLTGYNDEEITKKFNLTSEELHQITDNIAKIYASQNDIKYEEDKVNEMGIYSNNNKPKITKEEYLKFKKADMTDSEIYKLKKMGYKLFTKYKKEWGIHQPLNNKLTKEATDKTDE